MVLYLIFQDKFWEYLIGALRHGLREKLGCSDSVLDDWKKTRILLAFKPSQHVYVEIHELTTTPTCRQILDYRCHMDHRTLYT